MCCSPDHTQLIKDLGFEVLGAGRPLSKGSYVVDSWVCYVFWVRGCNVLPKKELHGRVWVNL